MGNGAIMSCGQRIERPAAGVRGSAVVSHRQRVVVVVGAIMIVVIVVVVVVVGGVVIVVVVVGRQVKRWAMVVHDIAVVLC